jgi:hypothetical protein
MRPSLISVTETGKTSIPSRFVLVSMLCGVLLCAQRIYGQAADSIRSSGYDLQDTGKKSVSPKTLSSPQKIFNRNHFIIPAGLIVYGAIAVKNDGLRDLDKNTQEEIWDDHTHKRVKIDNYLQFTPALLVYALNAGGIAGEHNFPDRSMLYLMSNIFLNITVSSLKPLIHQQRPDGSDYLSFPSGHTAEAFASAEFLRLEYRNKSPLYGVGGYLIAATTGYLRMYNNKHYLSDVLAGAGIGILSTDLAYYLYPKIKRLFVHKGIKNALILPYYHQNEAELSLVSRLP